MAPPTLHPIKLPGPWSEDAIVPVAPSRKRAYQPVVEIAKAIGRLLSVPVDVAAIVKAKDTPELKNVFDFKERTTALQGAFKVNEKAVRGKRIPLVDDCTGREQRPRLSPKA